MATATHTQSGMSNVVLVLTQAEMNYIRYSINVAFRHLDDGDTKRGVYGLMRDFGTDVEYPETTFRVVTQKIPRVFSRVRMTKDCGRWIKPGEHGIISSINPDDASPEGTLYTVAFEPGRYQTMTRECFEVL